MSLLSVDPGKNEFSWAYFIDDELKACDLISIDKLEVISSMDPNILIIEVPQIYLQRGWKGDPNDLIDVTITAGMIAGYLGIYRYLETRTIFVRPHNWKGNRPKDIDNKYTLSLLNKVELKVLDSCDVKNHKKHNVIDAIGIGLWKLGRR